MPRFTTSKIQKYVHFIGSSRSGHTLIAQMINSHKDAIISNEVNAFHKYQNGQSVGRLFRSIYQNSVAFAENGSFWPNKSELYSTNCYGINKSQGRTEAPIVIGDKFAASISKLYSDIDGFVNWVKYPVKFVHVIRDPYYNINSMANMNRKSFKENEDRYYTQQNHAYIIGGRLGVCNVYYSAFDGGASFHGAACELIKLFSFLGLSVDKNHICECIEATHDGDKCSGGYEDYFSGWDNFWKRNG